MSGSENHEMSQEIESLISRQFEGELSGEEHQRLQEWINSKPENAKTFVEFAMLHDRLMATSSQANGLGGDFFVATSKTSSATSIQKRTRWAIGVASSLAALLLISFFIIQVFQGTPALAAETQLERLIEVARKSSDRTYLITSLDLRGKKRKPREESKRSSEPKQSTRRQISKLLLMEPFCMFVARIYTSWSDVSQMAMSSLLEAMATPVGQFLHRAECVSVMR